MSEQRIFENGDVVVTDKRFIVGGRTYAVVNITSVRALERTPNRIPPVLVIVLGVMSIGMMRGASVLLIVSGIIWLLRQKRSFHVAVTTSAGESQALTTRSEDLVTDVVRALNTAIVMGR